MFLRLAGTEYDGLFLFSSAVLGDHQRRAWADGGRHAEGERAPRCQGTAARTHQCLLQVRRLPDTSFWFPSTLPFLLLLLYITIYLFFYLCFVIFFQSIHLSFLSFFLSVVHYFLLSFSYLSFSIFFIVLLPSTSFLSYHCYCVSRFLYLAITIYLFLSVFLFLSGCSL